MITGPLFKSFIESEDARLCEPNKTRQMMTNWPAAEIMLMGSWERGCGGGRCRHLCRGVGEETARDDPASAIECDLQQMEFFSQFKRVTSGQRVNIELIHFSFSAYFPSPLVL